MSGHPTSPSSPRGKRRPAKKDTVSASGTSTPTHSLSAGSLNVGALNVSGTILTDPKGRKKDKTSKKKSPDLQTSHSPSSRSYSSSDEREKTRPAPKPRPPKPADQVVAEFINNEGAQMEVEALDLVTQFNEAFLKVSKGLLKPNVLITGITGAGKSSLINAIFGKNVAETGTGVPLTQHFTKYESDDMRVVIYDSKGLEHGEFEDFMNTTDHFFESHKPGTVSETDTIHVVWYIVNSAHSRWEPFEEVICRKLLNRAPLMFVLNKADISSPRDRKGMKKLIHDMRLPHCKGVFETIAQPTAKLKNFEVCPECGSDDLVVRTKLASMRCEACGHMESLQQVDGLAELIEATCKVIPDVLKGAFISAQNVNFHLKEEHSRKILTEFWGAFAQVRTPTKLLKVVAQMMAKLSIIWEFKRRGQEYGFFMAKDLVSAFTWKEKLNLLFQNKIEVQRTHITALGILWYRCLRTFTWELLRIWSQNSHNKQQTKEKKSKTTTTNSKLNESCSLVFKQIFSHLTEQNILSIETAIQHKGLEPVLNEDMKWTDEEIDE